MGPVPPQGDEGRPRKGLGLPGGEQPWPREDLGGAGRLRSVQGHSSVWTDDRILKNTEL